MTRRYRRREAAQWAELIAQQQASGQSQVAFCRAKGLALSSFQRWRRILDQAPGRKQREARDAAAGPMFTELMLPGQELSAAPAHEAGWEIELELGAGARLRIRRAA